MTYTENYRIVDDEIFVLKRGRFVGFNDIGDIIDIKISKNNRKRLILMASNDNVKPYGTHNGEILHEAINYFHKYLNIEKVTEINEKEEKKLMEFEINKNDFIDFMTFVKKEGMANLMLSIYFRYLDELENNTKKLPEFKNEKKVDEE